MESLDNVKLAQQVKILHRFLQMSNATEDNKSQEIKQKILLDTDCFNFGLWKGTISTTSSL